MTTILRVEKPNSPQGLWYTTDRELKPIVHELELGCASLPMDFDPEYQRGGLDWFSGCDSMTSLRQWFSGDEFERLRDNDFRLALYKPSRVREYAGHHIFTKTDLLEPVRYLW